MIPGLGERLKDARRRASVRLKRDVSQAVMARLVTEELARLGSEKTISQPQWSEYEAEKAEPSTIVYRAVAHVSGVDESQIAFGDGEATTGIIPVDEATVEGEKREGVSKENAKATEADRGSRHK